MKKVVSGKTIAPYSPAVIFDDRLIFTSGQIPDVSEAGADIGIQSKSALNKLKELLERSGSGLDSVLKVNVFLTNMSDFSRFNDVYKEYFSHEPPARSAVGVAALPLGVSVEIEAVAYRRSGKGF